MDTNKYILLFLLITPQFSNAATGDILYRNCSETGGTCTGTFTHSGGDRTIETTGCYDGSCLKFDAKDNGALWGTGALAITASGVTGDSITVQYYVKFGEDGTDITDGNIKTIRPYFDGGAVDYIFASLATWFGNDFYSSWQYGDIVVNSPDVWSMFTCTQSWQEECVVATGTNQYKLAPDGEYSPPWNSYDRGRLIGSWNQNGQSGYGTTWTKVTQWMKTETSTGAKDGEGKLWINDELMWSMTGVWTDDDDTSGGFTSLTFYPSSEAGEDFEHWMDEMVVYEGYVPPTLITQHYSRQ